uniref:Uncharacterized protein n=1 Tax=Arundo donax TaxID=35708 RepID=A0A0A9HMI7_ARUDO
MLLRHVGNILFNSVFIITVAVQWNELAVYDLDLNSYFA